MILPEKTYVLYYYYSECCTLVHTANGVDIFTLSEILYNCT